MANLTHFSLFSGIGGIDLAAEWAGFETVGQCEYADYPTKVLEKHWPDVPRWRDIRTLTGESFYERTKLRTVDLVSGGFPCQPFSVAGNQKGKNDDRYLWPEMLRVIRELAPRWVIGENVSGIINIAGRTVCEDLEREGYDIAVFNFEASAVGAPHRRDRVFFVANRHGDSSNTWRSESERQRRQTGLANGSYDMADTKHNGQITGEIAKSINKRSDNYKDRKNATSQFTRCDCSSRGCDNVAYSTRTISERERTEQNSKQSRLANGSWWTTEPDVGRVAHGIPARVDRLKCLGNAVVPQQVYPILQAIADIENQQRP